MESRERPLVVIISGDEMCCAQDAAWLRNLLEKEFALRTLSMDARSMNRRGLRRALQGLLTAGGTRPMLIVYGGHGGVNGWAPWHAQSMTRITYQELAPLAKRYAGPLLFVNSSCFAMAMVDEFERQGVPSDRVGVIAACDTAWTSVGGIVLEHVAISWLRGRQYRPGYMAEAYLLEATKKKPHRVEWFYDLSPTFRKLFRNKLLRRWYGLRSLVWTIEHATFFSKRWGAQWDDELVLRHRVIEPAKSVQDQIVVEIQRLTPHIQEVLVRLQPPRL